MVGREKREYGIISFSNFQKIAKCSYSRNDEVAVHIS